MIRVVGGMNWAVLKEGTYNPPKKTVMIYGVTIHVFRNAAQISKSRGYYVVDWAVAKKIELVELRHPPSYHRTPWYLCVRPRRIPLRNIPIETAENTTHRSSIWRWHSNKRPIVRNGIHRGRAHSYHGTIIYSIIKRWIDYKKFRGFCTQFSP